MKRLRRAMLNTLTVLSLLLAILVAGSWVRSYWKTDSIRFARRDKDISRARFFSAPKGHLFCALLEGLWDMESTPVTWFSRGPQDVWPLSHKFLGIGWERNEDAATFGRMISIPHAYPLAIFITLPFIRLYRHHRRHRIALIGHCTKCGYDLRATPNRCPECGTVPTMAKS